MSELPRIIRIHLGDGVTRLFVSAPGLRAAFDDWHNHDRGYMAGVVSDDAYRPFEEFMAARQFYPLMVTEWGDY